MQRRAVVASVVLAALVVAGCSRLTFIRPKLERGDMDRVAPVYEFKNDDARTRNRLAAMEGVAIAQQRLQEGQVDEAERHAKAALKASPNSVEANLLLGMIAQRRGQSKVAGSHYANAAKLGPQNGAALNNYGAWLCENGRATESVPLFEQAARSPGYGTPDAALANAGTCALRQGDLGRAEADLRQSLALNPGGATALASMAELQLRRGAFLEARAFSERRLSAAPATPDALQLASQIERKLGDTAAADRYVQRMRSEFPPAAGNPPMGRE